MSNTVLDVAVHHQLPYLNFLCILLFFALVAQSGNSEEHGVNVPTAIGPFSSHG